LFHGRRQLRRRLRRAAGDDFATTLIQRQADLLPTVSLERQAWAGRRLVVDVDDAIWHDRAPSAGAHPLALLKASAHKARWLARRADTVIAGNDLLAEWFQPYAERIVVVPSLVEHVDVPARHHADTDTTVLGWIGSRSTSRYLGALATPLARLATSCPGRRLRLMVVGGEAPAIAGIETSTLPWNEENERSALAVMDIGLMPLPDTPWTRGKCAYKALQYMAAGVPVVADDVGVTADVIGHDRGGLVARTPDDWVEALRVLAGSASLRARLGAVGRATVATGYSVERWAPVLAGILRGERA
jgi:glycosyltransferase involved in cell wall biosynthesis